MDPSYLAAGDKSEHLDIGGEILLEKRESFC